MANSKTRVFVDANTLIQAGRPPGGPLIERLSDLVKAGMVEVITTDLTINEVARKHSENDYDFIKEIGRKHVRHLVKEYLGVNIPDTSKADIKTKIRSAFETSVKKMMEEMKATVLAIDDVKPSSVFEQYSFEKGFFAGEGKKAQFPDAFIFERLQQEASEDNPITIISNDGDFKGPTKLAGHLTLLSSIADLFAKLGLAVEAPDVESFLHADKDELNLFMESALSEWTLQASDVEDASIEVTSVSDTELSNLVAFRPIGKNDTVLVVGTAEVTAEVIYSHPNWDNAMWDSEDKVLIPFEDVEGETEITLEAEFSMLIAIDKKGRPINIEELTFTNDDFVFVTLQSYEDWLGK